MVSISVLAQNLVPNPSFENYTQLPCNLNQQFIQDYLVDWLQPITTSTDFWNTSTDSNCLLNPLNFSRNTKTGSGMIGLVTASINQGFKVEYKEYAEIKLTQTLKKDKLYCGALYAFNINASVNGFNQDADLLESNNISIAFSDSLVFYPVSSNSPDNLIVPAQAKIREKNIIPTDNSWHRVEGCFIADKEYEYLLIGNFNSVDSTLIVRKGSTKNFASAYYFIDDVSLVELPYQAPNLLITVTLCHDQDSAILDATVDGATGYNWQDGTLGPQFKVTAKTSKSYTVIIAYNQYTYRHTFYVNYVPDVDLGSDSLLCRGESITLKPNHPIKDFFWYDQSSDSEKVVTSAGTYWIEIISACKVRDTIVISEISCPGFIPNVFTPNGDEFSPVFAIENIEYGDWSLQVFNRWGEKVYESRHYKNSWDGGALPSGVYYYNLSSTLLNKQAKGWVQIIHDQ